jgi:hypothetical protein
VNGAPPAPRGTTARTLLWAAGILTAVSAMLGSPAGGILGLALASLLAVPALFVRGRTRWLGATVLLAALALGAARLPDGRREMTRHGARARAAHHGSSEASR